MANQYFFPEIEPYEVSSLAVDEPHVLYYEQCGNPDGAPILFLHGKKVRSPQGVLTLFQHEHVKHHQTVKEIGGKTRRSFCPEKR